MKTKSILVFSVIIISINFVFAREVSVQLAEIVARNIYSERINAYDGTVLPGIQFSSVYTLSENNISLAYVFNVMNDNGFVIIAAQDNVYPVLVYSFSGNYTENDYQPAFFDWIQNYKDQIYFCVENNLPSTPAIDTEWNRYSDNNKTTLLPVVTSVAPLLSTKWNQGCYYNGNSPVISGGPCGKAYTGCGATAMAQMMKYHQYPSTGTESYSYTWNAQALSANFGATTYNWSMMPNTITAANGNVAELMYHCGVSLNMNYGASISTSFFTDLKSKLSTYFGYMNTAQYWNPAYTWIIPNDTVYQTRIAAELDSLRPVFYLGSNGSTTSHIFLCDGYQNSYPYHFHFNWGWGGAYDGYFYCSALNPGSYNLTSIQKAIIRVMPSGTTTGIENNVYSANMIVYPNPSTGRFIIQPDNLFFKTNISVTNIIGEKILSQKMEGQKSEVDLSKQPDGIYFLTLKSDYGIATAKIVVSR